MQLPCAKSVSPIRNGSLRRHASRVSPLQRMISFPWCGAGASVYRKLALGISGHIEVLSVQLPGREDRFGEPRLLRMEQMVEHVIDDIVSVFDRPLVLFGHSMGALIAYEVALALRDRIGREPISLIVSGHGAPHCSKLCTSSWHTADDCEFIANIRQLGGTPDQLLGDPSLFREFMPLLRADYQVVETYKAHPRVPLTCPLIACAGDQDREVTPETMRAWLQYTTGPRKLHWFSGDHFYLSSQPNLVARQLEEWVWTDALGPGTHI
jgi:surfactin synthase thioesterase subunit